MKYTVWQFLRTEKMQMDKMVLKHVMIKYKYPQIT